ncbi:MAG: hypothetical protein IPI35_24725 [Deltaproteobacteria bacterium]|nr:hypothetical protein [Deltaproteobacteria bacterium]
MAGREQFRLNIEGADEDVPRLLLAYGRGCGGEVAFVLRPRDGEGVLVHQVKGQPAQVWVSNLTQLPEGIRPSNAGKLSADGPQKPAWAVGSNEAVSLIKRLKASPPKAGPATLRGTWKGELRCNDMRPTVHLQRKVAAYGTLHVESDSSGRWTALFERGEKWFSTAKQERTPPYDSLGEAIQRGMVQMTGLVSEACSFRDTRRRNTVDPSYAEAHPYRPPREVKDPTEKYNPRAKYAVNEGAAGWNVLNDAGAVIAAFGAREKGKASAYASALNRGESPVLPEPTPQPEPRARAPRAPTSSGEVTAHAVVTASGELEIKSGKHKGVIFKPYERGAVAGMVGQRVQVRFQPDDQFAHVLASSEAPARAARAGAEPASEVPLLKDVPTPEAPSCPTSVAKIASATQKEADALEDLSGSLWGTTEGPELLRRAAKLIRHAESLVRSPLCKGAEQKAAWNDLKGAAEAYSKARDALAAGQSKEVIKDLRQIAEKVSLAAARAAKACGQGGTSGGGGSKPAKRTKAEPAPAPVEAPKKGGKKPKAEDKSQAEKDQILMSAFSSAISAAVQQMQVGGGA